MTCANSRFSIRTKSDAGKVGLTGWGPDPVALKRDGRNWGNGRQNS